MRASNEYVDPEWTQRQGPSPFMMKAASSFEQMVLVAEEAQLHIEQERMLCYVGMTRAAEALYLLTVKGEESCFVHDVIDKVKLWQ